MLTYFPYCFLFQREMLFLNMTLRFLIFKLNSRMPSPPRGYTEGESCPTCGKTLGKYARYSQFYPYCSQTCINNRNKRSLATRLAEQRKMQRHFNVKMMSLKSKYRVKRMTRRHSASGRGRSRSTRRNTASA